MTLRKIFWSLACGIEGAAVGGALAYLEHCSKITLMIIKLQFKD
jgi:hypothetical protein